MANLELDPQIRDWVLLPLTLVMVLIGVLRHFIARAMRSEPKVEAKALKDGQVVIRARFLRGNAWAIPHRAFEMRRHFLCNEENGLLHVPQDGQIGNPAAAAMLSDPNVAMDMMKKNLSMIVPQTLIFAWVNFFFSGFVAAKIPFPLTLKFRGLLQNGIDLSTVDVSYVSSRSWYFLNFLGLRSLFVLLLGEDAQDDAQRMMAMQMGAFGADPNKMLTGEKNALELVQHRWGVADSEERAVSILKEKLKSGHWLK